MREFHTAKRSLAELTAAARENLARQQQTVALDTKRLNARGYINEDVLLGDQFKTLEAQITSLQLECSDVGHKRGLPYDTDVEEQRRDVSERLTPGISVTGSDEVTLWSGLEMQYDDLLKTLVNESLEDSMRVAASSQWEEHLKDWEDHMVGYEKALDAVWPWGEEAKGQQKRAAVSKKVEGDQQLQQQIGKTAGLNPRQRLLLNLLNKPPEQRRLDTITEIVKLSCAETIEDSNPELSDTCAEIWDIIISLCGSHRKSIDVNMQEDKVTAAALQLKAVAHNSLRCLEDACRRQLLHQLGVSEECFTGHELLRRLIQFCSLDGTPTFPDQEGHFWQLMYWSLRCGSPDALSALLQLVSKCRSVFTPQEVEIFETFGHLLTEKLQGTSRSQATDEDSVWAGEEIQSVRFATQDAQGTAAHPRYRGGTLDGLLNMLNSLRVPFYHLHSTLPILLAIIHSEGPTVSLREYMPNATAEDFLWYNLHLAVLKPLPSFPKSIAKLQRCVLQAGPKHFGSGTDANPNNLNFAKIVSMALAPTAAVDWLIQTQPGFSVLCLQWLVYLSQFGLCGLQSSLTVVLLPDLHQFIGSLSISHAFNEILMKTPLSLATTQPDVAAQWCELLPIRMRLETLSSIVKANWRVIFNDQQVESHLLGSIGEDGSGSGGLLYRVLMSKSWDSVPGERDRETADARRGFDGLVASAAEEAFDNGYLMSALRLSYLITQDRSCMKFLLKIFSDPTIFPSDETPTLQQSQKQKEALKFFAIFESRIMADQLQEVTATFEVLRIARQVVAVYQAASLGLFTDAWNFIIGVKGNLDLFPHSGLVAQWKSSDLESHLPRLIEVCAKCLQAMSELHKTRNERDAVEGIRDRAEVLLDSCTHLSHRDLYPKPDAIKVLRSLASIR